MFNFCASRLPFRSGTVACSVKKNLLAPTSAAQLQVATLKATHGGRYPYLEPYPYRERPLTTFRSFFESTLYRFNENTKIIIVEGNIGVGKTEFAKRLAFEFDLHYVEPPTEKSCFTRNEYGFDIRSLRKVIPESYRPYDLRDLYQDPHPEKGYVARLITLWYMRKFETYWHALKHVLSTGQGAVIPSSVYSDNVYVQALHEMGWVSEEYLDYYKEFRASNICELFRPHLTIFLDAPVDALQNRIKERKDSREIGAKNLTDKYLEKIGEVYKRDFLPYCRKYGEVVEIDWKEVGTDKDMEAISEELRFLKLQAEDKDDIKFYDWNRLGEEDLIRLRLKLDNIRTLTNLCSPTIPYKVKELVPNPEDVEIVDWILLEHPAFKYSRGWDPQLGHKVYFRF